MVWYEEGSNIKKPRFFWFLFILIVSSFVLCLTIGDILFGTNNPSLIFILYAILYGITFLLFFVSCTSTIGETDDIYIFKKTLYGKLFHFQCPTCKGIFAVKESMYKTHGKTIITCPDCGHLGRIKSNAPITVASIPEKKSRNVIFKCMKCGESLRIWAEGTELYPRLQVYSCPFCGFKKPLKKY